MVNFACASPFIIHRHNDYAEKAIAINREAMKASKMEELYAEFSKKKGKQYMDKIRSLVTAFTDTEAALLVQRKEEAERTVTLTRSLLIIITLLAIIISSIVILLITKRTMLQLGDEPEKVARISRKISEGDLTQNYHLDNQSTGIYRSMLNISSTSDDDYDTF